MSLTATDVPLKKGPRFVLYKGKKSKPEVIARALRALTMILRVGESEARALEIVGEQYHKYEVGRAMEHAAAVMRNQGASLQQALLAEEVFPRQVKQLVSAATTSQSLHANLAKAASLVTSGQSIKKKMAGSLIQPIFMIVLMIAFLFVAVQWIIPGFNDVFSQLGAETPMVTRMVLAVGDTLAFIIGFFLVTVSLLAAFWLLIGRKAEWFRAAMDTVLINTPAIGGILKISAAARLFELLASNLTTGMREPEALEGAATGCGNAAVARHCKAHAKKMLRDGVPLKGFANSKLIPTDAKHLLASAPSVLQEVEVMKDLYPEYDTEAEMRLNNLTRTVEPLVTYLVYGTAGVLIVSVMLPMYSIYPLLMSGM